MPIKWSAVQVSEAMDEVEQQVTLAEPFIDEAIEKAKAAMTIANLPQYLDQRLNSLIFSLKRIENMKMDIESVRNNIPNGAIEAEQERTKHGSQQSLI